jgi:hypothetical protein
MLYAYGDDYKSVKLIFFFRETLCGLLLGYPLIFATIPDVLVRSFSFSKNGDFNKFRIDRLNSTEYLFELSLLHRHMIFERIMQNSNLWVNNHLSINPTNNANAHLLNPALSLIQTHLRLLIL